MKIEIGNTKPDHFATYWPEQYELFSHFEYACGIPSVLHTITTLKENGKPNVNFNFAASFTGDGDGYFAIVPLMQHSHTYQNIKRSGEFVINFVSKDYYDHCYDTITHNEEDTDELEAGGFHREAAKTVSCPRMQEAFLVLECKLEKELDLSGSGKAALLIGRVNHIAMEEKYAEGIDAKYDDNGFMQIIHAPKNLKTGEGQASAVAVCKVVRVNEEG
ncbi:MAG: flavin reductase [Anaerolineaceae bacterium]|nr:flavin reductase [Anaerolineaceae bacterium]